MLQILKSCHTRHNSHFFSRLLVLVLLTLSARNVKIARQRNRKLTMTTVAVASISLNVDQTSLDVRALNNSTFDANRENIHPLSLAYDVALTDGRVLLARTRRWDNRNAKSFGASVTMPDGVVLSLPVNPPSVSDHMRTHYHNLYYASKPAEFAVHLGLDEGSDLYHELTAALVAAEAQLYTPRVEDAH